MSNRKTIRTNIIKRICRRVKRNNGEIALKNSQDMLIFIRLGKTQRTTEVSVYNPSSDEWTDCTFEDLDTHTIRKFEWMVRYWEKCRDNIEKTL